MKYTIIYTESFMCGCHMNTYFCMKQIKVKNKEEFKNILTKLEIDGNSIVYMFKGWPNIVTEEFLRLNEENLFEEVKIIINELIALVDRYEDDYIYDYENNKMVNNPNYINY